MALCGCLKMLFGVVPTSMLKRPGSFDGSTHFCIMRDTGTQSSQERKNTKPAKASVNRTAGHDSHHSQWSIVRVWRMREAVSKVREGDCSLK